MMDEKTEAILRAQQIVADPEAPTKDEALLAILRRAKKELTIRDISERVNWSEKSVREGLLRLRTLGHNIKQFSDGTAGLSSTVDVSTERVQHTLSDLDGNWQSFGALGDNHLCNRNQRLDVLNAAYDLYEAEGVTTVYNTGNWIDGEKRNINEHELLVRGMDAQLDYFIDNYPQRKGITTYFIAGDDHEGWYAQRECVEIGRYAELRARAAGREDLVYLGYISANVDLQTAAGPVSLLVLHPGGGSAYALSYRGQKFVEALQGGTKPAIVLQGHYHKFNLGYPREVWVLDTGTTCDQTGFMFKKGLQAMVGFCVVSVHRHPRGGVNRIRTEFVPFYDRQWYKRK